MSAVIPMSAEATGAARAVRLRADDQVRPGRVVERTPCPSAIEYNQTVAPQCKQRAAASSANSRVLIPLR